MSVAKFAVPGVEDLWFLPLGGCGEIGMNMNLYGHDGHWLMVDCGLTFQSNTGLSEGAAARRHVVEMPDPKFISAQNERLIALIITHAHEDHIGAVAHLWPQLQCPVYCTPYVAAILRQKLVERGLERRVPVNVVTPSESLDLGPFRLEWVALTHSIVEAFGLVINTDAGKVFHTADWKLDSQPLLGHDFDQERCQQMASEDMLACVCDSTNALTPGHSESESTVARYLLERIKGCSGRVVVTCFGSNIARLQTLNRVARQCGRYMGLLGRSLERRVQAARETGYWDCEQDLVHASHLGYLPRDEVLAVATGSQGEARTALVRLAADSHPDIELEAGDTVVFSAKTIPGNELAVEKLVGRLKNKNIQVVQNTDRDKPIHASGHPCREELSSMYRWVQPKICIPVHGEEQHLSANADIARASGVKRQLLGKNGDLFYIAPVPGIRRAFAEVGRLGIDEG